ncbi:unnamed protein product [Callosobruchus maculatus]|uniref:Uncharacterized protein n=1 Tax=Callosobruchus maculatus TaxID=64391 RepID=A0A653CII1_CALMS|nr:unnamed protein product [Callosobruchus maculatus]
MVLFHDHKIQLNKFSTFAVFAEIFFKKVLVIKFIVWR